MTQPRQTISSIIGLVVATMLSSVGCAPNANGVMQPALPWTRGASTTSANAWGAPNATATSLPPQDSSRWAYLNELMRRANQQQQLAELQRKELERMRLEEQGQLSKQQQYVNEQREKERAHLLKEFEEKERLLAEREQRYKGQFDQLRGSATNLDANNRDLHAQLARTEREREMLRDELDLLKRRLGETTNQLTRTQQASLESRKRLQALQASASQQRGNAAIRANSSISRPVTAAMVPGLVPGLEIRQDQDLVRISVPSSKLFMEGTASLHQGSQPYMDQIVQILMRHYPQQIVVVEAHTDQGSAAVGSTQWRNLHQLTAAQAMAVFEQLTARRLDPRQLSVLGHGANHPLVSGGTLQGQEINKRIEIVVYPETYNQPR